MSRLDAQTLRRLGVCFVAVLSIYAPERLSAQDSSIGRLRIPTVVQERTRTDSLDNALLVQALEKRLKCTCGCNLDVFTCRTTDFTCTTSPALHGDVLERLRADGGGLTQASVDRVIASFVAQYGESILMQPPKSGFNWTAYLMPFVALLVGLGLVGAFARHMLTKSHSGAGPEPATPNPSSLNDADRAALRRALDSIES